MKKLLFMAVFLMFFVDSLEAQSCLSDGITFTSQSQIDSFPINYPGCFELEGDVIIYGNDIINLNGLSQIVYIREDLYIVSNDSLNDLTGFENLISISGHLQIEANPNLINLSGFDELFAIGLGAKGGGFNIINNDGLTSFAGLDALKYIGGYSTWGGDKEVLIIGNDALISLSGLESLISIGACYYCLPTEIRISENLSLSTLSGIDNINPESIKTIEISENPQLQSCEVESVCDFLIPPYGYANIYDNASGCNSKEDVIAACESVSIEEINTLFNIEIYPNPSSSQITIELPSTPQKNTSMTLYKLNGQHLITQPITETQIVVDVSELPKGVYFVKVVDDEKVMMGKVVKD